MRKLTVLSLFLATSAFASVQTYHPWPGATYEFISTNHQKIHVLKVDLTDKRIRLRVTSPDDAMHADGSKYPMGPHTFAKRHGIQMAINGSIGGDHDNNWRMNVSGLVKGYGKLWPFEPEGKSIFIGGDIKDCGGVACSEDAVIGITADNQVALLTTVTEQTPPSAVMPDTIDIAHGGRPVILWDGVVVNHVAPYEQPLNHCSPAACTHAPRTAWGLSADRKTLILAVVDGRRVGAEGKTTTQLGQLMLDQGAWWAVNLDGGGSSAMYIKGMTSPEGSTSYPAGIMNQPSDGRVRTVPLQIGVQVVKPFGDLRGAVRIGDPTTGVGLPGVAIQVKYQGKDGADHVKTATTGLDGRYAIDGIYAGLATVTTNLPGGSTRTKLITAGDVCTLNFGLGTATAVTTSAEEASQPIPELVDDSHPDFALKSVTPVPPETMDPTDFDPDFPATKPQSPAPVTSGCSTSGSAAFAALALLSLASRRRRGHDVSTGDISWLTRRR